MQIIETLAVCIALAYAWVQIRDSQKNSKVEAVWEIYRELAEDGVRSSRKYLYNNRATYSALYPDGTNLDGLTQDDWHHASAVSNSLDRVGFLVAQGLIPIDLLIGFRYVIGRSWVILEPFIVANRHARNEPSFQIYFEELARAILEEHLSVEDVMAINYTVDRTDS